MSDSIAPVSDDAADLEVPHIRLLPEWSPCRAVLLAWPYPGSDWQDSLPAVTQCYWQLLAALLADASDPVQAWVMLHPSMNSSAWLSEFEEQGLPREPVKIIDHIAYDDTWIRDYGPLSMGRGSHCNEYVDFAFNGWGGKYPSEADDNVSAQLASHLEQMPLRHEWVLEGGALEVNGAGVLLANRDCVIDSKRNGSLNEDQVVRLLKEHLGITTIEWLEDVCLSGDDTDGHVDTMARFAAEDCLVYAGRNIRHPDCEALERLHEQVTAIAERNQWRQLELPSPVVYSDLDGRQLPATYANFLIVNRRVLAPIYGLAEDEQALEVLQHAFPMHAIVPVNCAALVEQHGSLHCATMQIAQQDVVR